MGHLQANGFDVRIENVTSQQLLSIKQNHGVPDDLSSCHTALANGYLIEGHVPADSIASILSERPDILGLAVPGMPPGAPGMGGIGAQAYDIIAFSDDGRTWVFSQR